MWRQLSFRISCSAATYWSFYLYPVFGCGLNSKFVKVLQPISVTNQFHEFFSFIFWREMMWRRLGLFFRNALEFPARQQHIGLSIYLYSRLLLSIKFLLGFNFLTCRMELGTSEVAHSGSKWPQTAKNKFARCDFTSFSKQV